MFLLSYTCVILVTLWLVGGGSWWVSSGKYTAVIALKRFLPSAIVNMLAVCVCVPLVNKVCAERQLVVFPRLDTLNAVTLQENAHRQADVCVRSLRGCWLKRYRFCPAFNLFSLITPQSSTALAESLSNHAHVQMEAFIHKCTLIETERCCN